MKKIFAMIAIMMILTAMSPLTMAYSYTVDGAEGGLFGTPTSVEPVTVIGGDITDADNVDRSKNSQIVPPPLPR